MERDLRDKIRSATEDSGITKPDFVALLKLIDQHYDKMEATITQSLRIQSEAPLEAIFDSITDAFLAIDTDGIIRNCNKVCARYFGRPRTRLIGSHIGELLPALGDQTIAEYLSPFMSSLDDTNLDAMGGEVLAQRVDGTTFDARINANSLDTIGGEIFVLSLRDISDRKKAESALRENEERYRALVENAPEAIIVYDVDDNRFVDANDKACMLFNLSQARLLTIGPQAISPSQQPDGTPSFGVRRGYVDNALAGGHPTFEWLHQDSNGRRIPCEVRFSRLPSDKRRLLRVSITDIEERKRNEALAHAQNKVLEMIAAGMRCERTLRAICRFVERIGP
ncbi:MAG: PAS domain S-box protein, partial [Woeseiaceae bacterium]